MSSERRRSRSAPGEVGETSTSRSKEKLEEETKQLEMSFRNRKPQKETQRESAGAESFDDKHHETNKRKERQWSSGRTKHLMSSLDGEINTPAFPLRRVNQGRVEYFVTEAEKDDFQVFTPVISEDNDDETNRSQSPGRYSPAGLCESSLNIPDTGSGCANTSKEYLQVPCQNKSGSLRTSSSGSPDSGYGEMESKLNSLSFNPGADIPDKTSEGRNTCSTYFSSSHDDEIYQTRRYKREQRHTVGVYEEMQSNFCQLSFDHKTEMVKLPKHSGLLDENYDEKQELVEINQTVESSAFRDETKRKEKHGQRLLSRTTRYGSYGTPIEGIKKEKSPSSINEPQCSLNLSEKPEFCTRSQCCTPEKTIKPECPASPLPRVNQGLVEYFFPEAEKDDQQMFTPIIIEYDDDEAYRFQSSGSGLYQCRVTGLMFHMQGQGEVFYRIIPWDRKLLSQHKKKPVGPLFDIKCQQKSMFQLHLPHCEILSSGGGKSLSTAHVNDDGVEFIQPHAVTETHVIINIPEFSGFGNVQDEDSPPDPVRALVLLFYKLPHDDRSSRSSLSVLLVPRNIVIRDVQRTRRKLNGFEMFLDVCPHCKLKPKQVYTLSTGPEDALIKVQPREAEFDEENHSSYFTSLQVILRTFKEELNLNLMEKSSSTCVWEQEVCLPSSRAQTLSLPSSEKLFKIRSKFIQGVSEPVLQSLLDKLLENRVITDSELVKVQGKSITTEKARFVLDTLKNKGEDACSKTVEFLCEVDPFFSGHLGLM